MEPRVPQNLILAGDAKALDMEGKRRILPCVFDETKRNSYGRPLRGIFRKLLGQPRMPF